MRSANRGLDSSSPKPRTTHLEWSRSVASLREHKGVSRLLTPSDPAGAPNTVAHAPEPRLVATTPTASVRGFARPHVPGRTRVERCRTLLVQVACPQGRRACRAGCLAHARSTQGGLANRVGLREGRRVELRTRLPAFSDSSGRKRPPIGRRGVARSWASAELLCGKGPSFRQGHAYGRQAARRQ